MGKGGRGKNKTNAQAQAVKDAMMRDDQAISKGNEKGGRTELTPDEVVAKLNAVPSFCLLNGENMLLGLKDLTDETGQRNVCAWFTDPKQATEMLTQCKAHSPELADGLHLGITPLGVAYAFACGWAELEFDGDKQVHGSMETKDGMIKLPTEEIETMRKQAVAHGLESRAWHVPVYACAELAHPARMPLFLSRKALAESWIVAGRKLSELDTTANVRALDLGVVVDHMQKGEWDGRTVQFVCERKAIALVNETKQQPRDVSQQQPGAVSPAEVPPGQEPTRENAVGAIQQALLAEVTALHGDAKGGVEVD